MNFENPKQTNIANSSDDSDRFSELMSYKVSEILVVTSIYESFIMERDGLLQDQLFSEYQSHRIHFVPSIRQATTSEEAFRILNQIKIDLVITGVKLPDCDLEPFVAQIKDNFPNLPVVLLAHVTDDLRKPPFSSIETFVDNVFVWTGDSKLLLAMSKWLEDMRNVAHDTEFGDVRVIIVVEDSPRYYSAFLPIIYTELMKQSEKLLSERLNIADAVARSLARPKILLAKSYEEAISFFNSYKNNILGVISDISFPRKNEIDPMAGFTLAKYIKEQDRHIPVILQSADIDNELIAHAKEAYFVSKNSSTMLQDLRKFLLEYFGFGDFIFRLPSGEEVGKASTVKELGQVLENVPIKSLERHSQHNDFSHWLFARGEFKLAKIIRPVNISDFENSEQLRKFLVQAIRESRNMQKTATISDFNLKSFDENFLFERIGIGSLGGKARGLAFINYLLANHKLESPFSDVAIKVPKTLVIASDQFDQFLEINSLASKAMSIKSDDAIRNLFLKADLPKNLFKNIRAFLDAVTTPLAIRSSSLFEDSKDQPFAGIYETVMIPNNQRSFNERLDYLCRSIKLIYASTFFKEAKDYFENSSFRLEEERMSVIIQEVVGKQYGTYFYPNFSGVAQSYNFYPISHINPEDGSAHVVLGFGKAAVEGGVSLRFCPKHPHILPQFPSPNEYLKHTQKDFWVLDLQSFDSDGLMRKKLDLRDSGLRELSISAAEAHGTLTPVGGTYSPENHAIYDGVHREGIRIINFSNILKHNYFPLSQMLSYVLETGANAFAGPVEIEFAVNLKSKTEEKDSFYLLQIRPYLARRSNELIEIPTIDSKQILVKSSKTLGNRHATHIKEIVFIIPDAFDTTVSKKIADQIGHINQVFLENKIPYLLITLGRLGTSDPSLGIPVSWSQISNAEFIIEAGLPSFRVEPSCGTHFFHNLTARKTGYFSIDPLKADDILDWSWLCENAGVFQTDYIKHIRLEKALDIRIDGRSSKGIILKP